MCITSFELYPLYMYLPAVWGMYIACRIDVSTACTVLAWHYPYAMYRAYTYMIYITCTQLGWPDSNHAGMCRLYPQLSTHGTYISWHAYMYIWHVCYVMHMPYIVYSMGGELSSSRGLWATGRLWCFWLCIWHVHIMQVHIAYMICNYEQMQGKFWRLPFLCTPWPLNVAGTARG